MKKKLEKMIISNMVFGLFFLTSYVEVEACTTLLAGKNSTNDGSTMIARNEDMGSAWAKHFVVREENSNDANFVSAENGFSLQLPEEQLKYTATPEWDVSEGLFEEGGINSKNIAMSATESTTVKEEVLELDPLVENGISESSMLTVVLPYIESAKDGVERLGKIIEEEGTAEMNGVIFSDKDEIWYMDTLTGHHWAAVRVPDDQYAVIANTVSIQEFDWDNEEEYLYSDGLKDFIDNNELADTTGEISIREIFADTEDDAEYNLPRVWYGQQLLTDSDQQIEDTEFNLFETPDEPITVQKVAQVLGSHYEGTEHDPFVKTKTEAKKEVAENQSFWDKVKALFVSKEQEESETDANVEVSYRPISVPQTMESHILQIRNDMPEEISAIHWLALGVPDTSNYIPFYSSITETPVEYQMGDDEPDGESAYWAYREIHALAVPYYDEFKETDIVPVQEDVWTHMENSVEEIDAEAEKILEDNPSELSTFLNEKTKDLSDYSLDKYKQLSKDLLIKMTEKTSINHNEDL